MATEQDSFSLSLSPPPPPRPIFTLRPRANEVTSVQYTALNDNREAIFIGTSSGVISLWDIETKREFWKQSCERGIISVCSKTLSSNVKEIISLSRQGTVCVWDLEKEKKIYEFVTPDPGFCNFIILGENPFSKDTTSGGDSNSTLIALGDREYGQVNVFDTLSRKQVMTLKAQNPETKGMVMSITGGEKGLIMCGCEDGSITLFDIRTGIKSEISSLKLFTEPVMCLDYDSVRNHGVCGSPLNTLETFNMTEQKLLQSKYSVPVRNSGIGCVCIRHDGRVMASGGWDGRIRIFGCKKGKPLAVLDFHTATVHCLSFTSPHSTHYSNLMIGGSKDERVSLWKLY